MAHGVYANEIISQPLFKHSSQEINHSSSTMLVWLAFIIRSLRTVELVSLRPKLIRLI